MVSRVAPPLVVPRQIWYPVIGLPPSEEGAVQLSATLALPALAAVRFGAPGAVGAGGSVGVALRSLEPGPLPTALTAATW